MRLIKQSKIATQPKRYRWNIYVKFHVRRVCLFYLLLDSWRSFWLIHYFQSFTHYVFTTENYSWWSTNNIYRTLGPWGDRQLWNQLPVVGGYLGSVRLVWKSHCRKERSLGASVAPLCQKYCLEHEGCTTLICSIRGGAWVWLLPEHWGKGAARGCVSRIISCAFGAQGIHRVSADVDIVNIKSSALLESLGFQPEGIRRNGELKSGVFLELKQYSLLSSDPRPQL